MNIEEISRIFEGKEGIKVMFKLKGFSEEFEQTRFAGFSPYNDFSEGWPMLIKKNKGNNKLIDYWIINPEIVKEKEDYLELEYLSSRGPGFRIDPRYSFYSKCKKILDENGEE
jgi:hypothetical protein